MQWGIDNEPNAIKVYEDSMKQTVSPTGVWLSECGCMGASPDGLVGDDIVIEVKCPSTAKKTSIEELAKTKKDFCLSFTDGLCSLKQDHGYYHQVQGQLHLTNRRECHFVVWSPENVVIMTVMKDDTWSHNLDQLKHFYFEQLLPRIIVTK